MNVGPYEILGELGRGANGAVLRARAPGGREVALKVLLRASAATVARFEREVRLLATLGEHEGFVPLLDHGVDPRGPYLVMPLVRGGTLRERLARPWPADRALALARALARALGAAHARGIVHRDLKPENVLFTEDERPLIADLGLAKDAKDARASLSETGTFRGTLAYAAPEQLGDAKHVGPAADAWALGAILYECLAGVPAFDGESAVEVAARVAAGSHVPVRSVRPDLPVAVDALVERCLAVDPGRRFASGLELARALERAPRRRGAPLVLGVALAGAAAALLFVPRPGAARPDPAVDHLLARARAALERAQVDRAGLEGGERAATEALERAASAEALLLRARLRLARSLANTRAASVMRAEVERIRSAIADAGAAHALAPEDPRPFLVEARARCRLADGRADLARRGVAVGEDDHRRALACASRAHALDPRSAEALELRATMRVHDAGAVARDEAFADLERAEAVAPGRSAASIVRSELRARLGDPEGALAAAREAVRRAPRSWEAHLALGEALQRGQPATDRAARDEHLLEADRVLTWVLGETPENVAALSCRAAVRYDLRLTGRARLDGCIADASRLLELVPGDATALRFRASCLIALGRCEEALSDLEVGLDAVVDAWGVLLLRRAVVASEQGPRSLDAARTLRVLDLVLDREPGNAEARFCRAQVRIAARRLPEAIADATLLIDGRTSLATAALVVRGEARLAQGDREGARADASAALATGRLVGDEHVRAEELFERAR